MRKPSAIPAFEQRTNDPQVDLYITRLLVNGKLWELLEDDSISMPFLTKNLEVLKTLKKCKEESFDLALLELDEQINKRRRARTRNQRSRTTSKPLEDTHNDSEELDQEKVKTHALLKKDLMKLEEQVKNCPPPAFPLSPVFANMSLITLVFDLSFLDKEILTFVTFLKKDPDLAVVANLVNYEKNTVRTFAELVSTAIRAPIEDVLKALSPNGRLYESGVLVPGDSTRPEAEDCYTTFMDDKLPVLFIRHLNRDELFENFMTLADPPKLAVDDYDHVKEVKSQLIPLLETSLRNNRKGCNILLYGKSGTGKTELAKAVASYLNQKLFSVVEDSERRRSDRLSLVASANKALKGTGDNMILVDECDDIFNSGLSIYSCSLRENKAGINKVLESNDRPTFWICNNIQSADSAILRRFDLVIEMSFVNRKTRKEIFRRQLGSEFSEQFLDSVAANDDLSFAVVGRAMEVVRAIGITDQATKEAEIVRIINQTLNAQNMTKLVISGHKKSPYDVTCVNCDRDLIALKENLRGVDNINILLYGAPGTGKTAYVHWIAEELGKELVTQKASSLLNMYVGGTEKNIAGAFSALSDSDNILLFDEADSFLRDRQTARQSWDVTQVNELLTQMENHKGIFVATTNLMDSLDEASLRRFHLKIKFDWLTPKQRVGLFKQYGEAMGLEGEPTDDDLRWLRNLDYLAPGDFANVFHQSKFMPVGSYSQFAQLLTDEQKLKRSVLTHNPVGFA